VTPAEKENAADGQTESKKKRNVGQSDMEKETMQVPIASPESACSPLQATGKTLQSRRSNEEKIT
jgi:hypothetical protein